MWKSGPVTEVYPDQTRLLSSTPQRCQATIPRKRYQYHPLHHWDHSLLQSTLIPTNQQRHMDLYGSSELFHQNWTISTCRPNHLIFWQQWREQTLQQKGMMETTVHNRRSLRNRHRYRRPRWTSAQLTDGRRLTRRGTITPSTPAMKPGEFIFSHQALHHRRHNLARWKGS